MGSRLFISGPARWETSGVETPTRVADWRIGRSMTGAMMSITVPGPAEKLQSGSNKPIKPLWLRPRLRRYEPFCVARGHNAQSGTTDSSFRAHDQAVLRELVKGVGKNRSQVLQSRWECRRPCSTRGDRVDKVGRAVDRLSCCLFLPFRWRMKNELRRKASIAGALAGSQRSQVSAGHPKNLWLVFIACAK